MDDILFFVEVKQALSYLFHYAFDLARSKSVYGFLVWSQGHQIMSSPFHLDVHFDVLLISIKLAEIIEIMIVMNILRCSNIGMIQFTKHHYLRYTLMRQHSFDLFILFHLFYGKGWLDPKYRLLHSLSISFLYFIHLCCRQLCLWTFILIVLCLIKLVLSTQELLLVGCRVHMTKCSISDSVTEAELFVHCCLILKHDLLRIERFDVPSLIELLHMVAVDVL